MPKFKDLTGQRVGFLTITHLSNTPYKISAGRTFNMWHWICDCGNTGCSLGPNLVRSRKKFKTSCGCNSGGARENMLRASAGFKICYVCKLELPVDNFHNCQRNSTGLSAACKLCKSIQDKTYRNNPKVRTVLLEKKKVYHKKIKGTAQYTKALARRREVRDYAAEYQKEQQDNFLCAKKSIRKLILHVFKKRGNSKHNTRTEEILGCSFQQFEQHIAEQFQQGMSWDNHGEWHLDHIVPLTCAHTEEELVQLNHYTNFQPLWAKDNMTKGDTLLLDHYALHTKLLGREPTIYAV